MKRFKRILVAVDTRLDVHPLADEAADIALHNGATLKIVDVVPDFPWTARLTMKDHEHVRELIRKEKQEKVDELVSHIRERGVDAEAKVLEGKTSVEIIREVIREDHDLVLRVHKGQSSRRQGFFGNTGIRLLRKCPCAVWLVMPDKTQFDRVLGCIDTSSEESLDLELNEEVFESAKSISEYHRGTFAIIHTWSVWNAQFLQRRMTEEEFQEMVRNVEQLTREKLDRFLRDHGTDSQAENVHLVEGEPPAAISELAREKEIDLVVMGTVARSGVSGVVIGNTAEQILSRIECSVLALKPSSFVCPVKVDD